MPADLVTIPGVPILRTGTYSLGSGERTFAEEDLVSAAQALATDQGVKAPRIKIDSLAKALGLDPAAHGGEPAFGWFDNLVVAEGGQELLADAHVPQWIADAMEWAYPTLSIEGTPPGWTSSTGRQHDLVITAVALLGVEWPGVTTLDDFREVLASGQLPEATAAEEVAVVASMGPRPRRDLRASLDADLVVRRFIEMLDTGGLELPEEVESAWDLWPRTMRFDDGGAPYLKVTDERSGLLYRVDFTVSGSEVSFGAFVEVVEQDVPVAASAAGDPATIASWASRAAVRASINATEDRMTDAQRRALAVAYGLDPETATDVEVNAAVEAGPPTPQATEPATPAEPTEPTTPAEPAAVAASADTVTVSRAVWDGTLSRLGAVEASVQDQERTAAETRRTAVVAQAIREGRIAPSERDTYLGLIEVDETRVTQLLASMAPGRLPVTMPAGGHVEVDVEAQADVDAAHDAYMRRHWPKAAARLEHMRRPVPVGAVEHRQEV